MRLISAKIHNFGSFNNSPEVELNPEITVLIGKNESGKTTFLKALEAFNPDWEYEEKELCRYARETSEYKEDRLDAREVKVITVRFAVEDSDRDTLKGVKPELEGLQTLTVTKFFDDHYAIESPEYDFGTEQIEEAMAVKKKRIAEEKRALRAWAVAQSKRYAPFSQTIPQLDQVLRAFRPEKLKTGTDVGSVFEQFAAGLNALPNMDSTISTELATRLRGFQTLRDEVLPLFAEREAVSDKILEALPAFIYFSTIEMLGDEVTFEELEAHPDKYRTLANLMSLAKLNAEKLVDADSYARISLVEDASAVVTGLLNESWTQEAVLVKFWADGKKLVLYVRDETGALDPPSRRRQGFQWFLSFYTNFIAGSRGELKNTVILLDDPGVYLHGVGQKDLLRTLERLAESNQTILATHSPFLIDPHKLERVFIVEKRSGGLGSVLHKEIHKGQLDALQPVRAALGLTLGDSLFLNKRSLILEGFSDYWILEGFSKLLQRLGREHLLLPETALIPVGGADNIPYFVLLLEKENHAYAVLVDNDTKGRSIEKEIKSRIQPKGNPLIFAVPAGGAGQDSETEDLIDAEFYNSAVNAAYAAIKRGDQPFPTIESSKLPAQPVMRTKKYEAYFKSQGLGGFDNELVARKIYEILTSADTGAERVGVFSLDNFETLIREFHKRLGRRGNGG